VNIITTNLGFADWTQVFGDPVMTAALLDRLTHKAHIINCAWESYRLKQSLKGKNNSSRYGGIKTNENYSV
jgi:DNA replication protein DnaC